MKYAKAILEAVSPLQLCGGFELGCEATFHAMSKLYKDDDTEAMLFVDASNAFNQLNREATLINSQVVPHPSFIPTGILPNYIWTENQYYHTRAQPRGIPWVSLSMPLEPNPSSKGSWALPN